MPFCTLVFHWWVDIQIEFSIMIDLIKYKLYKSYNTDMICSMAYRTFIPDTHYTYWHFTNRLIFTIHGLVYFKSVSNFEMRWKLVFFAKVRYGLKLDGHKVLRLTILRIIFAMNVQYQTRAHGRWQDNYVGDFFDINQIINISNHSPI